VEVKNEWSCASTSAKGFLVWKGRR
jgi:hypothetical protein